MGYGVEEDNDVTKIWRDIREKREKEGEKNEKGDKLL